MPRRRRSPPPKCLCGSLTGSTTTCSTLGRGTNAALKSAYEDRGESPEEIARLLHYTEYDNAAYSLPDYHAAFGPTYEDPTILQWLLDQRKPAWGSSQ